MTVRRPPLAEIVRASKSLPADAVLQQFLAWVADTGLEPYPEQRAALQAIADGKHVVLATPTGSGKSLVALGMHVLARCRGERSFYTCPTKALANEKFFSLCADFGPEFVGMLTGDASINHGAPLICCTAEVLSNMCLRGGAAGAPPFVAMDEFHFYGDPERGVAWQVPLLTLRDSLFVLMSATFGPATGIVDRLRRDTDRDVVVVESSRRPVPLDYEYRETSLHETVRDLLRRHKAPIYVVSFSQRAAADVAQALTSTDLGTPETKGRLREALALQAFDTPYGRDLRRVLGHGVGIHHAGLLPRYRLLVERLAQQGLLNVISGTDTLGLGVNIPIRSVVLNALVKFDGRRFGLMTSRTFHQIVGRAGRKGYDDRGSVVVQAPPHVIEAKRRRAAAAGRKPRRTGRPAPGTVVWNRQTFQRLLSGQPEALISRFRVDHGMVLAVLQRPDTGRGANGYASVVDLVLRCHEDPATKRRLLATAAARFRDLRHAGLVSVVERSGSRRPRVEVDPELQVVFSLHESLSLYAVDACLSLDPTDRDYALRVVSVIESIVEDPVPLLRRQERAAKSRLLARLKADGVPYEERLALLDAVTYPQPESEFLARTFRAFAERHPWVRDSDIHPKSVAREMIERRESFSQYVRRYGMQRSEGLLLRHLSRVYDTLQHTVPEAAKTDALCSLLERLRREIRDTDSSLIDAWERLRSLQADPEVGPAIPG